MAESCNALCLDEFHPETDLMITNIKQQKDKILIRMKLTSKNCKCSKCNYITEKYHGTYRRKVLDLPILGKRVQFEIYAHEYECMNDDCKVASFIEIFDGFLNTYSRMTERRADFMRWKPVAKVVPTFAVH